MTKDKIKERKPIFNEEGELKASLDEIESDIPRVQMFKFNFEDEEGKKLLISEIDKMVSRQREYLSTLSFPEKMKTYGHTFESLAEAYRVSIRLQCEFVRRLRLIYRWQNIRDGPIYCTCSAMVYDAEDEGTIVPYLYCVIKDGMDCIKSVEEFGEECATCENTPCGHFWEPLHDSKNCKDYSRRKSEKYLVTPCIYANPSDEDIDRALELHEEEGDDEHE